jgi:hypothetical protein
MLDVPLEVPLGLLPLGGRGQGGDSGGAGRQVLGDPLDRAALPSGVAALEDDDDPRPRLLDPRLQLAQLTVEPVELGLVDPVGELGRPEPSGLGHLVGCGRVLGRHATRLVPSRRRAMANGVPD